ncbi:MAG TPA: hypothetical protein VGZ29_06675 [Terriglobia bacterium]|nr:hypothetical protein [Terriglobia bacterium]
MRTKIFSKLGVVLIALASSMVWAQEPDAPAVAAVVPDGQVTIMDVGGAGGPRRMLAVPMFEGVKPVTGAPFSAQATTEISQVLADGNRINNKETATVARDSSGRTRRDGTVRRIGLLASAGSQPEIVRIVDPAAGMTYMLDVGTKTAVKVPLKSGPRDAGVNPKERVRLWRGAGGSKWQAVTESLGDQMMAGVDAQGTRTTETIPAGAIGNEKPIVIVSERWYSPDLQETIYSKRSDPRFGTTIYQLTNISRQEPDPALFQVPADYTVQDGRAFKEGLRYQIQGKAQ